MTTTGQRFARSTQLCGSLAAVLGAAALVGWLCDWRFLTAGSAKSIPMAPNTGCCFIALGLGLVGCAARRQPERPAWLALAAAVSVFGIAGLRLVEYIGGVNVAVDEWFLRVPGETFGLAPVGKMAYLTAVGCVLAAAALLLLALPLPPVALQSAAGALAVTVATNGAVFSLGYLLDAPLLYGGTVIPMALPTAIGFILAGAGLLTAGGPTVFPARSFVGASVRARLLRVLMPFSLVTVCASAWLTHLVLISTTPNYATLFTAALAVVVMLAAVTIGGRIADLIGGDLEQADAALRTAHDELEGRVERRTKQLKETTALLEERNRQLQELAAFYDSLVESLPQNILRKDRAGRFTFGNRRFCATLGMAREQIVGKTDFDFYPAPLAEKYRWDDEAVIAAGKTLSTVEAHVTPGGERLYVHVMKSPIYDAAGNPIGTQGIFSDVTDQRRAEQRLTAQHAVTHVLTECDTCQEAYPRIVQAICESLQWDWGAVWLVDESAEVLRCTATWPAPGPAFVALETESRATLLPRGRGLPGRVWETGQAAAIAELTQDANFPRAHAAAQDGLHSAVAWPILTGTRLLGVMEFFQRDRHQPDTDVLSLLAVIGSHIGQFVERKSAEEERDRFFMLSLDMLCIAGIDGYFRRLNPAWEAVLGYSTAELQAEPFLNFIHPEDRAATLNEVERLAGGQETINFENRYRRKDGTYRWLSWKATPILEQHLVYAAARDITDRRRAEEELRSTADELHRSNQQLQQLAASLEQTARSERLAHEELKKAESQLIQTERLAALGQLVAGVAHEINNPLSFVSNNIAVLDRDVKALRTLMQFYGEAQPVVEQHQPALAQAIRAHAEAIDLPYTLANLPELMTRSRDGLKRIQQIVKDLRDFARLDESELQEADLNAGVESTLNIVRGRARKQNVELHAELSPLPTIHCYPAKINQVVLNLVANAIDACPRGGKVTVQTQPVGAGVEIHVIDTGTGIDPAIRDRIFDPFFTTKPVGQGTGLGLSISYGIIQDHDGKMEVKSTVGQGTHFIIRLPAKPRLRGGR